MWRAKAADGSLPTREWADFTDCTDFAEHDDCIDSPGFSAGSPCARQKLMPLED
jgi:hypothetical protein